MTTCCLNGKWNGSVSRATASGRATMIMHAEISSPTWISAPWRCQEAQQEEDQYLHHTVEHVEERHQVPLALDLHVAQQYADQIGSQIPVAAHEGWQGVGEKGDGKDKDRREALGEAEPGEYAPRDQRQGETDDDRVDDLAEDVVCDCKKADTAGRAHLEEDHHEHVGGRIVASALHLQQ